MSKLPGICSDCVSVPVFAPSPSEGAASFHLNASSAAAAVPTLPWTPAENCEQPRGYYHARAAAWTSEGGAQRGREVATEAIKAGYTPKQTKMDRPLEIQGVGHGTQKDNYQATLPIALMTESGESIM